MPYQRIRLEEMGPVARLTLSWPEKRNALSIQMMEEVTHGLKTLAESPGVRAVILGAEGTAFSAGHFLAEMVDKDLNHQRLVFDTCVEMMETVQGISQPVIAEVPERILIETRPTDNGRGFELVYVRQIIERTVVPDLYQFHSQDEMGRPTLVRYDGNRGPSM